MVGVELKSGAWLMWDTVDRRRFLLQIRKTKGTCSRFRFPPELTFPREELAPAG